MTLSHLNILIRITLNFRTYEIHAQTFCYEILNIKLSHYRKFKFYPVKYVIMTIFLNIFVNDLFMHHKDFFYYLLNCMKTFLSKIKLCRVYYYIIPFVLFFKFLLLKKVCFKNFSFLSRII